MKRSVSLFGTAVAVAAMLAGTGCPDTEPTSDAHGPVAEGISAHLGDPLPELDAARLAQFDLGQQVARTGFLPSGGLGPAFNVASCAACHERPVLGGGAGLYRNFALGGTTFGTDGFLPATSAGPAGAVLRVYYHGDAYPARPPVEAGVNTFTQRNPIPFFGVGLIAELSNEEILRREDIDDRDGDGISGKANFDRGFVGRFGRKSQTVSIEGFIRGPLFNHLGLTTDPLSEAQKGALPVDSTTTGSMTRSGAGPDALRQAAAPETSLIDDDGIPDPELPSEDLFNLVSFAMLLAAPELETLSEAGVRGRTLFDDLRCGACHTPRLQGPRGPLPVYSDLLLHDMGTVLADGIVQGLATGAEFRTQPLWGIGPVGPYLHDGRAQTLADAVLMHDGEAKAARDAAAALPPDELQDLVEFMLSLGGRDQTSGGLLPPDDVAPAVGQYGGPSRRLTDDEALAFEAGRRLFDREFGHQDGAGGPRLNGDSCRACHFEPTIGGAGPLDVNVMRHGTVDADGVFVEPAVGTILHKSTSRPNEAVQPQPGSNVFEPRQTPPLFGLGLIDQIPDAVIIANADPDDALSPDGITGRVSYTNENRLGRFGWKAQVPSVAEFVRDALGAELGMTLPPAEGLVFGAVADDDDIADPELSLAEADLLALYLERLGPPPRSGDITAPQVVAGQQVFTTVGCAACHTPALDSPMGPVSLYSDLLLHETLSSDALGIEDTSANMHEFRTPPLWGIAVTAPYMHDGAAETLEASVMQHDGEAATTRDAYVALSVSDRAALLAFLATL